MENDLRITNKTVSIYNLHECAHISGWQNGKETRKVFDVRSHVNYVKANKIRQK